MRLEEANGEEEWRIRLLLRRAEALIVFNVGRFIRCPRGRLAAGWFEKSGIGPSGWETIIFMQFSGFCCGLIGLAMAWWLTRTATAMSITS
jgi:hypothetical protein